AAPSNAPVAKLTRCGNTRVRRFSGASRKAEAASALSAPPNNVKRTIQSRRGICRGYGRGARGARWALGAGLWALVRASTKVIHDEVSSHDQGQGKNCVERFFIRMSYSRS